MGGSYLGLVGPGGITAANDALRRIREEKLRAQLLIDQENDRASQRELEIEKLNEQKRGNLINEELSKRTVGQGDTRLQHDFTRLGHDETRLGFDRDANARAIEAARRSGVTFDQGQTDRQEIKDLIPQLPADSRQLFDLRRLGMDASQEDLYTPEQMGSRLGARANAAWQGGGRNIEREREGIQASFRPENQGVVQAQGPNGPGLLDKKTGIFTPARMADGGNVGFRLPNAAVDQIAQSKSALASLQDLRTVLNENEQYIGPIAGLQALNPYSDARKAQAKIDLVKQRVGKALEGGVLRKEDEEKYKKILATLSDTPSTAIAKIDGLIETLQRDMDIYVETQRASGRVVGDDKKSATEEWERGPDGRLRRKGGG